MKQETNTYHRLTADQSIQLRALFRSNETAFDQQKAGHLAVILGAEHIRLSHSQLYMVLRSITRHNPKQVFPDWIYDLLSAKTNPQ